jgi:hypothetical protein
VAALVYFGLVMGLGAGMLFAVGHPSLQ